MTPRLHAVYFAETPADRLAWTRLARVLAYTAVQHCPDWAIDIEALPPAPRLPAMAGYVANTYKLDRWCALVESAGDGTPLLLIDSDTMIVRPLDPIWARPFDVAYTTKPGRFPFNAGVIALRVSDPVRSFLRAWRDENRRLLGDSKTHRDWRRKYGGLNQAALGSILEAGRGRGLHIATLPCAEWNCEDSSWPAFDPAVARIVHVKSTLRRAVLGFAVTPPQIRPLVRLWRELEQEATVKEAQSACESCAR